MNITYDNIKDYNNGTLKPEIGMYCNRFFYSDIKPYEIVGVNKTGKTLTLRAMDTKIDKSWKPEFIEGGFSGHCVNNNEQKWTFTSNPKNATFQVRLSKKGYGKGDFYVGPEPRHKYDYNF
jgi:hypothetical protein